MSSKSELEKLALQIRIGIVEAIGAKGGGHIGGTLDLAELLSVLYSDYMRVRSSDPDWAGRDYLISSKGHAGPALYATLALKGFFPYECLYTLNQEASLLPGHCDRNKVPGIDATTGSLGQGLSIACGLAHGCKLSESDQRVFCIIGDGEAAEGQIWEAAQFASHFKLDNLITFLDWNKMQIDGTNDEVMSLGNPIEKFKAFGWDSCIVNGVEVLEISETINKAINRKNGKPTMIVLDTVKGAGVSYIEKMENNHCIGLPKELYEKSIEELHSKERQMEKEV